MIPCRHKAHKPSYESIDILIADIPLTQPPTTGALDLPVSDWGNPPSNLCSFEYKVCSLMESAEVMLTLPSGSFIYINIFSEIWNVVYSSIILPMEDHCEIPFITICIISSYMVHITGTTLSILCFEYIYIIQISKHLWHACCIFQLPSLWII